MSVSASWRALFVRRFGLAVFAAIQVGGLLLPIRAAAQQPQPTPSDTLLTTFYQDPRPERLFGFWQQFQALPSAQSWEAYPPVAGFLAFVFRADPGQVEKLIPAKLDAKSAQTIAAALRLSGDQAMYEEFQPRLAQAGRDDQLTGIFANLPPRLEELRIATPSHLDILWGAAFASGDAKFVLMIIDYFARTADLDESVARDIARTLVAMAGGPTEVYAELRKRYGVLAARQIVFAASALWALQSNSRQHEFVARAVAKYIEDHPGTPAQKALAATRPRAP